MLYLEKRRLTRRQKLAALAQSVEHLTCNHEVSGSNPGGGSAKLRKSGLRYLGSFQSGQMGQTVNLLAQPSKVRILHSPL